MDWLFGAIKSFIFWNAVPYLADNWKYQKPICIVCCGRTCDCHKELEDEFIDDFYP